MFKRSGSAVRRVLAAGVACAVLAGAAAAQQAVPGGGRVIFDDFSDPRTGWSQHAPGGGMEIGYRDGTYQVVMTAPTPLQLIGSGVRFAVGAISVDVANLAPSVPHPQGLFIRGVDPDNYYGFLVQSDGTFTIFRWEDGRYYGESPANSPLPEGLYATEGPNALDIMAEGPALRFFFNFQEIWFIPATRWNEGEAGLLVGNLTFETAGTVFDNWRMEILR